MSKISVIVSVYGVEKYIERCCVSIFEQSYRNFEVIFVNDCSKDRSEEILLEVIARYQHLGIAMTGIKHEINKGISAARETGLNVATGEYVLYIDSDDYIAPDMLEMLIERANQTDADIVYCDYFEVKNGQQHYVDQSLPVSDIRSVTAAMLRQEIKWAPWNKIFRRAIALEHDIHWPSGINIGEDLVVMTKLFCYANKIEHIDRGLYFYNRDNVNSYLNIWNPASCYQNTRAVQSVDHFLTQELDDFGLSAALTQTKLMARFQMLYAFDDELMRLAIDTFPETDDQIFSYEHASLYWKIALYLAVKRANTLSSMALHLIWWMKKGRSYVR